MEKAGAEMYPHLPFASEETKVIKELLYIFLEETDW